jgi:catechol 2,3-dioxygenase-like lactoylglutathione lyase family enzyme
MIDFTLDHVGIAVADLDEAAAHYKRLGFQLTPRGYHTLPASAPGLERPRTGTGNHCAMFQRGYLELIGITDPIYQGRLRTDIARYEGLHVIAFGTNDAAAAASRLRKAGLDVAGPRTLERPIEENGETRLAQFEIVDFLDSALPEGHFFAIRHATPDLLWRTPLMTHPNGVLGLEELTIAVSDPSDFADRLSRFVHVTPVTEDTIVLRLAAGSVRVVDGAWTASHLSGKIPDVPYIAGLGLRVGDVERTADCLAMNGVAYRRKSGALMIAPSVACGAFLQLRT